MAIKFLFSGIKGEELRSMNLNELIYNENRLLMKMRMDNYFDEHDYELIKTMINEKIPYWKEQGEIPIKDFLVIVDFLDQTAGSSIFMDEKTNERVADAHMEVYELLQELHYDE